MNEWKEVAGVDKLKIVRICGEISETNLTSFKYVEEWSETNISGNNNFQWCFMTSSQVNWADLENCVDFLWKEMPDNKIDETIVCFKKLED
ncbi:hypothetical protein TNCV_1878041 [Trichonephila clavipes]|nr:hypothetical protein TNCV_1878041 [Trichonephila clavipes]